VKSKRVLKLLCFYIEGTINLYLRPLEGITLMVDLDEMKIVEYFDRFIVPVPFLTIDEYFLVDIYS
jgi:primary-amine oxidase